MASDVRRYIDGCVTCARYGPAIRSHELHPTLTYQPFDMIGLDFIGPLPTSHSGHRYILHIIDYFSRFTSSYATKSNSSVDAISCLKDHCSRFQPPIIAYHDPGTHFTAQLFKDFCKQNDIIGISSPSGASKSTGMIERANRILEDCLKKRCAQESNDLLRWPEYLKDATRDVNTRVITSLGYTPFEILFGITPRLPYEVALYPSSSIHSLRSAITSIGEHRWEELGMDLRSQLQEREEETLELRQTVRTLQSNDNEKRKARYDKGIKG